MDVTTYRKHCIDHRERITWEFQWTPGSWLSPLFMFGGYGLQVSCEKNRVISQGDRTGSRTNCIVTKRRHVEWMSVKRMCWVVLVVGKKAKAVVPNQPRLWTWKVDSKKENQSQLPHFSYGYDVARMNR